MVAFKGKVLNTLAVVPARGGSKSIPSKNIFPLGGKPLIGYVLTAVTKSRSVDRLIVSTDDEKIAAVARQYGAEVPFIRPNWLAEDSTPMIPAIAHAIEWLETNESFIPDYVLIVQPTEPFVKPQQIDEVFDLMVSKAADSGITMISVPRIFHPYHLRHVTMDGFVEFDHTDLHYQYPNRQSDPKRYAFGNLYWFRRNAFLTEKKIEVGKRVGLEIDPITAYDINDQSDVAFGEFLLERRWV